MRTTGKIVLIAIGIFFLFCFLLIFSFLNNNSGDEIISNGNETIAIIEVNDEITESTEIVNQIKKFRKNNSVRSFVLRVNSPGGSVGASQEIYAEIKKTRESGIPVIVSMGDIAASGGYYISLGANKILANPGTLTGSIGVIMEFMHFNKLLDKVGISNTTIKSGKFKDIGSPFRKSTIEDNIKLQKMLDDVYNQFVDVVVLERKMSKSKAIELADGSVYSGKQAYELGLIDSLGTYEDAIKLASKLGGISGEPSIIKEKKKEKLSDLLLSKIFSNIDETKNNILRKSIIQYSLQF